MNPIVKLPRLYPIIDSSCFAAKPDPIMAILRYAEELIPGGRLGLPSIAPQPHLPLKRLLLQIH